MRQYWFINMKRKEYFISDGKEIDWDTWLDLPFFSDCESYEKLCFATFSHDVVNGIPYVYDLCSDGMLAVLLADSSIEKAEVDKATSELKHQHDVVTLRTLTLTRMKILSKRTMSIAFSSETIVSSPISTM